jgi:hypothetical protein
MFDASIIRVMIASPGDVGAERRLARDVVHEWNAVNAADRGLVLMPVLWETHASPAMGDRAQAIINEQLVRDSDLLVAIFWTKLGTPTGVASSGTVEEVESHLAANKPALMYFSSAPVRPDSVDEDQYRALRDFKASCRSRGLCEEYESVAEFKEKLTRQLAQTIIRAFSGGPVAGSTLRQGVGLSGTTIAPPPQPRENLAPPLDRLAADARELLSEAAKDPNGTVLVLSAMGGDSIETNERNFIEPKSPRSEARWRQAVIDLTNERCLQQRDSRGEVFSVTAIGYRLADLLSR